MAFKYRNVDKYGRIEVGQFVRYGAAVLAPTNSAKPCGCMRDQTGQIIHPDETIGFHADGHVVDLLVTESGCMATVALLDGGQIRLHINGYGQSGGNFKSLRVLRDAPKQISIGGLAA